jgi:hypothetical protein
MSDTGPDDQTPETTAPRGCCELCGRDGVALIKHHLIPRMQHRRGPTRRRFDDAELDARLLWACHPCHDHVHAVLTESELASAYHTRELLLSHPEIQRFAAWIAKKPPGYLPQSRRAKRIRRG